MGVALPNTNAFDNLNNPVDKGKHQTLCKEFGISVDSDLRWTRGSNRGLGDIYAYDHAHGHYSNVREQALGFRIKMLSGQMVGYTFRMKADLQIR